MSAAPGRCIACGDRPDPVLRKGELRIVRSPGCGLEWREPLPDDEELALLYGSGYLERWGARDAEGLERVRAMKRRSYAAIFDELERHRSSGRLLDLGCAAGFLLEVAGERGYEAFGLDLDAEAVALARARLGERVARGSLDARAFPGQRFHVVTLVDVFEHLPRPAELLAAARERLEPDGLLVALMPNAASWVRRLLGRRWPHYAPEHVFYWTPRSLERFLRDRGWQLRALRTGFRKTFSGEYLKAYAESLGSWLPPGVGLLGRRLFTVPTGEMLAIASPARPAAAAAGSAAEATATPGRPG